MLEYLTMLLVISLILIAILSFFRKHVPLRPRIIYSAVGISFALGSVFPLAVSTLTTGKVLTIYFGLIVLIATILSYVENRAYVNVSPAPLKIADLDVDNATEEPVKDSFSSILAEETAALEACAAREHPSNAEEPESVLPPDMELSAHDKGAPAPEVSVDYPPQTVADDLEKEDPHPIYEDPITVNDYVSSGFRAKSAGDLAGAVKHFITALQKNQEQQMAAALALEISAIYQELGQYFQAELILRSVIKQKNIVSDPTLRQKLQGQLIYLDTLGELLRITEISIAPYSKIPSIIKIKANLETAEKLKGIT